MKTTSSRFLGMPKTRPGWWSVGLAVAFVLVLTVYTTIFIPAINNASATSTVMPNLSIPMALLGFAAGIVGLVAIIRRQERSWLVWLSVLPGVFVILLFIGDFLSAIGLR